MRLDDAVLSDIIGSLSVSTDLVQLGKRLWTVDGIATLRLDWRQLGRSRCRSCYRYGLVKDTCILIVVLLFDSKTLQIIFILGSGSTVFVAT